MRRKRSRPTSRRPNRLTRSDGFLIVMEGRRPAVARALRRVLDAISAAFMVVIAYAIWPEFLKMWASQDFFGIPGIFTAPWWPIKLTIFLSACLCAIHFALRIILRPYQPAGIHAEDAA